MEQYLNLLRDIKSLGVHKPAARADMPGTTSLFGYQFHHNLEDGFPLLTTKKIYWKGIVMELLWFLRGDTNIKYLVDNNVNIWNEDAYNYYKRIASKNLDKGANKIYHHNGDGTVRMYTFDEFMEVIKHETMDELKNVSSYENYTLGDCGYQYGKVWRDWNNNSMYVRSLSDVDYREVTLKTSSTDQISNVIKGLRENPEGRRHIVTAIDPAHDDDLALYWCHAMFQFNARPMNEIERAHYAVDNNIMHRNEIMFDMVEHPERTLKEQLDDCNIPKYKLDCQLYQRSADVILGVPFNIASYALLIHIIAKMVNMVPGKFIHTFGDVHIYDNHKEAVETQLTRKPGILPTLNLQSIRWNESIDDVLGYIENQGWEDIFILMNYNPQPAIKAELSTGLKK